MTRFDLDPGFIKLRYDDSHRPHFQTLCVDPSGVVTAGVEPDFAVKGGGTASMSTCIAAYAAILKTDFAAATTLISAEFWSKPTPSSDPVWIFAVPINLAGTASGSETFTRQVNRSYRTGAGHLMRIVTEGVSSIFPNDTSSPIGTDALSTFLLGNTNFIVARDMSFPVAKLNYSVKTNDALRKKELGL